MKLQEIVGFFLIIANIALLVDTILQHNVPMLPRAAVRFTWEYVHPSSLHFHAMYMMIQAWRSCSLGLSHAYSLKEAAHNDSVHS